MSEKLAADHEKRLGNDSSTVRPLAQDGRTDCRVIGPTATGGLDLLGSPTGSPMDSTLRLPSATS